MGNFDRHFLNVVGGIVACGIVGILAFMSYALVYVALPSANENALIQLIGILSANVCLIVGFFFGSSVGAKKQAETTDKMADAILTAQSSPVAPVDAAITLGPGESAKVSASDTEAEK